MVSAKFHLELKGSESESCFVPSEPLRFPWTVAHQAPLSMGFSRQEYWSGVLFPSPGNLPDPRTEPGSPAMQSGSVPYEPPGKPVWSFLVLFPEFKHRQEAVRPGLSVKAVSHWWKNTLKVWFCIGSLQSYGMPHYNQCSLTGPDCGHYWFLLLVQILPKVHSTLSLIQQETLERPGMFPARRKHRQS